MAAADIYTNMDTRGKEPQHLQELAADNFHVFAGVQGAMLLTNKCGLAFYLLQTTQLQYHCTLYTHVIILYTLFSVGTNSLDFESMVCDPMMVVTMSGPMREP